jgi:hypothetical protein
MMALALPQVRLDAQYFRLFAMMLLESMLHVFRNYFFILGQLTSKGTVIKNDFKKNHAHFDLSVQVGLWDLSILQ